MWLVIWLAGEAAMVMGGDPGMSAELCNDMRELVIADIEAGTVEIEGVLWVEAPDGELLPWQPWEVTCESNEVELGTTK